MLYVIYNKAVHRYVFVGKNPKSIGKPIDAAYVKNW